MAERGTWQEPTTTNFPLVVRLACLGAVRTLGCWSPRTAVPCGKLEHHCIDSPNFFSKLANVKLGEVVQHGWTRSPTGFTQRMDTGVAHHFISYSNPTELQLGEEEWSLVSVLVKEMVFIILVESILKHIRRGRNTNGLRIPYWSENPSFFLIPFLVNVSIWF